MTTAIEATGLSKAYRIGLREAQHDTFAGAIGSWITAPWRNFRQLRRVGDLSKDRDAADVIWALSDINLEISTGEVVGVIGRNGAGKSTLLKVLSSITKPTTGSATIRGRVGSLLEVGTGFHPDLTGRENVYLNGTILGMKKAEIDAKFDEIVSFSEVERFIDTPTKRYSSGMVVRLAFSVAAHLEPEILLIDEVLAVGDAAFQRKCLGRMGEVASAGRTVVFVSHNVATIEALCDRVVVIEDGRVAYDGATLGGIQRYLEGAMDFDSTVDLSEHPRRRRRLAPLLRELRICNVKGEPAVAFLPNEDVVFEVDVDPQDRVIPESVLYLTLISSRGQIACTLRSDVQANLGGRLDRPRRFRCVLKRLRLLPGDYSVRVRLTDGQTNLDWVDDATTIEARTADVYGTGLLGKLNEGVLLADVEWEVD